MKVWIFNPYGNLPGEGWSQYRSTSIANALTARGHEVVWWVSNFEHRSKQIRSEGFVRRDFGGGFSARILPARPYVKHISIARILYERDYAHQLAAAIQGESMRPDIIIVGEPAICISDLILEIVRECKVPWIIDVIDLWPELFSLVLPRAVRPFERVLFAPLYTRRRKYLRHADGFLAVANNYLKLAQSEAPGKPGEVVYLGTETKALTQPEGTLPESILAIVGAKSIGEIWCIYVGTLGKNYDILALCLAASLLRGKGIKILVAGDGDCREDIVKAAAGHAKGVLYYLERRSFPELCSLYPSCDIALACYALHSTVSMPFKAFDYLVAGIPVVTSLCGDLGDFIQTDHIGVNYSAGDPVSLAQAIERLAVDDDYRRQAGLRARALGASMDYKVQYERAADFIDRIATQSSTA